MTLTDPVREILAWTARNKLVRETYYEDRRRMELNLCLNGCDAPRRPHPSGYGAYAGCHDCYRAHRRAWDMEYRRRKRQALCA